MAGAGPLFRCRLHAGRHIGEVHGRDRHIPWQRCPRRCSRATCDRSASIMPGCSPTTASHSKCWCMRSVPTSAASTMPMPGPSPPARSVDCSDAHGHQLRLCGSHRRGKGVGLLAKRGKGKENGHAHPGCTTAAGRDCRCRFRRRVSRPGAFAACACHKPAPEQTAAPTLPGSALYRAAPRARGST
jgi:hypothetical protein